MSDSLLGGSANQDLFVTQQSKELNTFNTLAKVVQAQREGTPKLCSRLYVLSAQWFDTYAAYAKQLEDNLKENVSALFITNDFVGSKLKICCFLSTWANQ